MWGRTHRCASVKEKVLALLLLSTFLFYPVQPAFAAFGGGTPTVPNPSVFTGQTEEPKVDGQTGAFTQQIPLDIPPGRDGLQPDVSLQYNSQNTSDSIVGYGWSLSIPYIQRLNKTGSQDLYGTTPYFTSSIEGELTPDSPLSSTTSPSILDTLPLTAHQAGFGISDSFSYTVPSGGQNKMMLVLMFANDRNYTATQNGVPLTVNKITVNNAQLSALSYMYLPNPTSGTFSLTASSEVVPVV
jgi:Salmonella virulence plasmid 65kDa B protein